MCRLGTVKKTRFKRRPIVDENNAAAIIAFTALNPHASSRQMEKKEWNWSAICIKSLTSPQVPSVSYVITLGFVQQ